MSSDASDDIDTLLDLERELTEEEKRRLMAVGLAALNEANSSAYAAAKRAYSKASIEDFARCVFDHLNIEDQRNLVTADIFCCPECGKLLKDRG